MCPSSVPTMRSRMPSLQVPKVKSGTFLLVEERHPTIGRQNGVQHHLEAARVLLPTDRGGTDGVDLRSEEHTSELQSLMRISYAVFCLKQKQIIQVKEQTLQNK